MSAAQKQGIAQHYAKEVITASNIDETKKTTILWIHIAAIYEICWWVLTNEVRKEGNSGSDTTIKSRLGKEIKVLRTW
ncbi:22041_t:CDS:2 [Dentiscutata erythropus]|uniref:22041_t:CDS:1 n=1 Tax=Dentiscutata erythropus TaxID=1348616 RepID=A0A9N8VRU6_9GLOM|nr:22041_t:CDS:2 [Dentiscutata erythropus]